MKKSMLLAMGAFLLVVSSSATFGQTPDMRPAPAPASPQPAAQCVGLGNSYLLLRLLPAIDQSIVAAKQKACSESGGRFFTEATRPGMPPGGLLCCECPTGMVYRDISNDYGVTIGPGPVGCLKAGRGSLPQPNQPAKRVN